MEDYWTEGVIGIDIDEILLGFLDSFLEFYNQKYWTAFQKSQFFSYNFWEVTGQDTKQCYMDVHEFFTTRYFEEMKPLDWARDAISALKQKGHKLVAITSRQTILVDKTRRSLERHFPWMIWGIEFGNHYGMQWGTRTKAEMCSLVWVTTLVEDSLVYAKECAGNGISVILMDSPWNQTREQFPSNITRVKSWWQALDILGVCE